MSDKSNITEALSGIDTKSDMAEKYKLWLIQRVVEMLITKIPPKVALKVVTENSGAWIDVKITSATGNKCHISTDFDLKPKSSIII